MSRTGQCLLLSIAVAAGCAAALYPAPTLDTQGGTVAGGPPILAGLPSPSTFPSAARSALAAEWGRIADLAGRTSSETEPLLGAALGRLGMLYHGYEREAAALTCFRRAATLDPEQPRWPYYAGFVQERGGELVAAAESLERALSLDPEAPWTILRLADVELARGERARAGELYRRVLEIDETTAAALAGLGRLALLEDRPGRAVEFLEAALDRAPEATRLYHPLAQARRRLGDDEAAREALARAGEGEVPRADPAIAELLAANPARNAIQRAESARKAGRLDDAETALREALGVDSANVTARYNLAVLLSDTGREEEAIEQYRKVLEIEPENTSARFNLGTLLASEERLEGAVAELEEVMREKPDFVDARFNLAAALSRLGRWEEAARQYAAIQGLEPEYPNIGLLRASALLEAGRVDEAATLLGRLVDEEPEAISPRLEQARALSASGRWTEARQTLETGLERRPRSGRLAHALARLLATSGDPAVRDPERAVELAGAIYGANPTPEHAETLALALEAAGRVEEARRVREREAAEPPASDR